MRLNFSNITISENGRVELNDAELAAIEASFTPTAAGSSNLQTCVNTNNCGSSSNELRCTNSYGECAGADNLERCGTAEEEER